MVIGSCCSFDPLTSDFPYPTLYNSDGKKTGQNLALFRPHLTFYACDSFILRKTFHKRRSVNPIRFPHQMTPIEQFSSRTFCSAESIHPPVLHCLRCSAKRCHLRLRMQMKEPHCGLFSGKATNVATPSSCHYYRQWLSYQTSKHTTINFDKRRDGRSDDRRSKMQAENADKPASVMNIMTTTTSSKTSAPTTIISNFSRRVLRRQQPCWDL